MPDGVSRIVNIALFSSVLIKETSSYSREKRAPEFAILADRYLAKIGAFQGMS